MIEPVRQGADLLAEIDATRPAAGALAVWWLGQSGFLIKSRSGTLVIDPYLSEHLTQKYAGTAAAARPDDPGAGARGRAGAASTSFWPATSIPTTSIPAPIPDLLAASPGARLVLPACAPRACAGTGGAGGTPGQGSMRARRCSDARSGFTVRAVPSAHEGLDTDAAGRHLYLGFVIEAEGLRLYHSGDSLAYDGLAGWLGPEPFDVLFLPINGRDPARGVAGNMSAAEAVALAAAVRPRFVVPHHYDMFTFNTVPVAEFEAEARRLPAGVAPRVLRCGERWEIHR